MSNEKYSAMPPLPRMSFFRHPIRNIRPCREASPEDIFKYLISDYAKARTETLRSIADIKKRREYKAGQFDYITPGGIFRTRKETDLIQASGYIVIDFDHVSDPLRLVIKLAGDDNFETVLAFRSPSGDGVKWIVSLPDATKPDGTPFTFGEYSPTTPGNTMAFRQTPPAKTSAAPVFSHTTQKHSLTRFT